MKNNQKHIFLCLFLLCLPKHNFGFEIMSMTKPFYSYESESVRISCVSDSYYEFCVFRHKSRLCEFEWKREHNAVRSNVCSMENVEFDGNYEKHECAIKIDKLTTNDQGEWSCEMQAYFIGPVRGASDRKTTKMAVLPRLETIGEAGIDAENDDAENIDNDNNNDYDNDLSNNITTTFDESELDFDINDLNNSNDMLNASMVEDDGSEMSETSPTSWTSIALLLGLSSMAIVSLILLGAFWRRHRNAVSKSVESEESDVEQTLRGRVELNDMLDEQEHNPSVNGMAYNGSKSYLDNNN